MRADISTPNLSVLESLPEATPAGAMPLARPGYDGPEVVATRESPMDEEDSSFKLYFQEIGKVKLLTAEEEIELARRVQQGDPEAREQMIKANLRLVVKIAKQYCNFGLPFLDLINEGNIGLMQAVERYDPTKGARFSTYSAFWIKQSIRYALAQQAKTIRLPVYMIARLTLLQRKSMELRKELGREPSHGELAEEMGLPESKVRNMQTLGLRPVSLDSVVGDDDSVRLGEIVPDENAASPCEDLDEKTLSGMLQELLPRLTSREMAILRHRFGFEGGREKTLDEIGELLGLTRERIRQIQNQALGKLRKIIQRYERM